MYLRAGAISMALLLASRVMGLLRESVQAAAFGTTAMGDLAVVMLTLPDLASAVFAAGAMSYALLPWWSRQGHADLAASQRAAARLLLGLGALVVLVLWAAPGLAGSWLAPGVQDGEPLALAVRWAAVAVPLSLLGSLWYTRLQHERDVIGMYGMNLVHTGVIIATLLAVAYGLAGGGPMAAIGWLGAGLLLAMALRLAFLGWRMACVQPRPEPAAPGPAGLPGWRIWLWALLVTGAPAVLVLLARSLVSRNGEGSLAAFNYAWKLVELPNLLAIQLIAALAFPALTRAHAEGRDFSVQMRSAFLLAWTLAWAAAVGLWAGARPAAGLLFGWGRMGPSHVAEVAQWAAWGGWTLPAQALAAVALLVLATTGRLRVAALAWAGVVAVLAALGAAGLHEGRAVMLALALLLSVLAAALLDAMGPQARAAMAWKQMAVPALLSAVLAALALPLQALPDLPLLCAAALMSLAVAAAGWAASPELRAALKR